MRRHCAHYDITVMMWGWADASDYKVRYILLNKILHMAWQLFCKNSNTETILQQKSIISSWNFIYKLCVVRVCDRVCIMRVSTVCYNHMNYLKKSFSQKNNNCDFNERSMVLQMPLKHNWYQMSWQLSYTSNWFDQLSQKHICSTFLSLLHTGDFFNSLIPGRCCCNIISEMFKFTSSIVILGISCYIALRWMQLSPNDG